VVIGCRDPAAPHTRGGIAKLRRAGVAVEIGVCEREAKRLVADFAKHVSTGLPFVTLKAAVTLDGRIATASGDSKWITGIEARRHAHRLRDQSDAVLVGVGTVLADDPRLDVRHVRGKDPLRVVVDSMLRTPPTAALLGKSGKQGALIFHAQGAPTSRAARLVAAGAELVVVPKRKRGRGLDLTRVLAELGRRGVVRLLVEGGGTMHGALLDEGLADRAAVFVAPRILGDAEGISLAMGKRRGTMTDAATLKDPRSRRFGDDIFIEGEL
jgi:diaminohydroxyphosphoribosylaminopyrimidine deaminase/5-amino-6-(5-phosphoribosylamino)uracil reductase